MPDWKTCPGTNSATPGGFALILFRTLTLRKITHSGTQTQSSDTEGQNSYGLWLFSPVVMQLGDVQGWDCRVVISGSNSHLTVQNISFFYRTPLNFKPSWGLGWSHPCSAPSEGSHRSLLPAPLCLYGSASSSNTKAHSRMRQQPWDFPEPGVQCFTAWPGCTLAPLQQHLLFSALSVFLRFIVLRGLALLSLPSTAWAPGQQQKLFQQLWVHSSPGSCHTALPALPSPSGSLLSPSPLPLFCSCSLYLTPPWDSARASSGLDLNMSIMPYPR